MLNPVLSNFKINISDKFFPEELINKYDVYLKTKNYPLKQFINYFHETIQNVAVPGLSYETLQVNGLNNTRLMKPGTENFDHPVTQLTLSGSAPYNEILTSLTGTITIKNTILNWLYCFEWMYEYYKRRRAIPEFNINIDMYDSAENPIMRFEFADCFLNSLPELEFNYNESFSETKTIDVGYAFNRFNVKMLIPNFERDFIML